MVDRPVEKAREIITRTLTGDLPGVVESWREMSTTEQERAVAWLLSITTGLIKRLAAITETEPLAVWQSIVIEFVKDGD